MLTDGIAMTTVDLLGLSLIGPGLADWASARPVLRGEAAYTQAPTAVPPPQRLPPAERRRAGAAIKIAMAVADAACTDAAIDPQTLPSVFTSSSGDGVNCHALCESLASPNPADRLISPTRFTNSVHNAAAGYWHIAVGSQGASTSLCAFDASFGAGLVAALTQVRSLEQPLLFVASDTPYPAPLHTVRPLPDSMGAAMVLAPAGAAGQGAPRARIWAQILWGDDDLTATPCRAASLEALRQAIPAAQALPLLEAIARGESTVVCLALQPGLMLSIAVAFPDAPAA